ncbi:hypothetical protein AHAS_Ahas16G0276000 [Arachis hypogaea]
MKTLMVDAYAIAYFQKKHFEDAQSRVADGENKERHAIDKTRTSLLWNIWSCICVCFHQYVLETPSLSDDITGASMSSQSIKPLIAA